MAGPWQPFGRSSGAVSLNVAEVWFYTDEDDPLSKQTVEHVAFDKRFLWVDTCAEIAWFETPTPTQDSEYCVALGALGQDRLGILPRADGETPRFRQLVNAVTAQALLGFEEVSHCAPAPILSGDFALTAGNGDFLCPVSASA